MSATHTPDSWIHKDEWKKSGRDFMVVVSRHAGAEDFDSGPHRWAVYAFIYPKHPYFAAFDGPNMWQEATSEMPFHGGCSLLNYPMYEGKVTSVKAGADYNHFHDQKFTDFATQQDAHEVFEDAGNLFNWLAAKATGGAS